MFFQVNLNSISVYNNVTLFSLLFIDNFSKFSFDPHASHVIKFVLSFNIDLFFVIL
jgi:hypothetical protein